VKNILYRSLLFLFISSVCTWPVFAADSATDGSSSLLLILFLGFFALIVVFQLVPAVLLFSGMVKGLLSGQNKEKEGLKVKS